MCERENEKKGYYLASSNVTTRRVLQMGSRKKSNACKCTIWYRSYDNTFLAVIIDHKILSFVIYYGTEHDWGQEYLIEIISWLVMFYTFCINVILCRNIFNKYPPFYQKIYISRYYFCFGSKIFVIKFVTVLLLGKYIMQMCALCITFPHQDIYPNEGNSST